MSSPCSLFKIRCNLQFQHSKEENSFLPVAGAAASNNRKENKTKQNKTFSLTKSSVVQIKQGSHVRWFMVSGVFHMTYPLAWYEISDGVIGSAVGV